MFPIPATEPARRVGSTQSSQHRVDARRLREDVGTELRQRARVQLEHGTVPEHRFGTLAAQNEPRCAARRLSARAHRPPAGEA
jgi:hypothetical protein